MMKKNQSKKHDEVKWSEQVIPISDKPGCNHYFEIVEGTRAECKHCKMGLLGVYKIDKGKPIV